MTKATKSDIHGHIQMTICCCQYKSITKKLIMRYHAINCYSRLVALSKATKVKQIK